MRRIFIFLLTIFIICFGAKGLDACSCLETPPPKEALKESDCVFVGKVIRHELEDSLEGKYKKNHAAFYSIITCYFRVEQIWKGTKSKEIAIVTSPDIMIGGFPFQDGQQYIVYATMSKWGLVDSDSARLITGNCSRTRRLAAAAEDLKELGEGERIK